MKTFAALAALAALVPAALGLTIDTPSSPVVCQPVLMTWHDGTGPYFPSVVAPGPGQTYRQFDQTDATSLTWKIDLPVGTAFNLAIKDSTGAQQYSATVTVQQGSDTSCLTASASESASATGVTGTTGATTGAATGSTTAAATGSSAATGGSSAAASGSASRSSAASASGSASASASAASGNAAVSVSSVGTFGVAAVMGLVGAALF